ncbi:TonB-dependent receptor [Sphingomonas sp. LB-2]|uniref:TonB-dependent receptor plug domain-containing protein n=1 Tax=Sphingomonas caeni TaxID=2984949 RepID=UPI00222FDB20|nr:TonB-dependent receptor [Sphingomonas caeni]MCW3845867.1 TonB-dependent receptor [Sphingomonas caeni]
MSFWPMRYRWCVPLLLSLAAVPAAAKDQDDPQDLSSLSIEELSQLPVRSASKREEPLSEVPTALYVITEADIARANGTALPEILRQAPNLHVERVNGSQYAITARGFNGVEPSNKILALVDGRSIYSTLHSGVFWELHAPLAEDLQQIEVVSGPGGTLYGPNAVNGVINVISKEAGDTQGLLVRGTGGRDERTAAARFGFTLGDNAAMRVYGNYFDRENLPTGFGPNLSDGIRGFQFGFRSDSDFGASHVTVQGDMFRNRTFQVAGDGNRGHDVLARWSTDLGGGSSVQIQGYYDYFERRSMLTIDRLETIDVEGQYNLESGGHHLVAGLGVRTTRDQFVNNLNAFQLNPPRDRLWIGNGFVQDRFALTPSLSLIAGFKLESSSFSGLQFLPNLRLAWRPSEHATLWASVSRAVRTPSRIDRGLAAVPILITAPDFASEKLIAFEAGYRGQPTRSTSLSVSVFYNRYTDLRSVRALGGAAFFPVQLANDLQGNEYGVEAWGTQQLTPWWRLSAGGFWLKRDFGVAPGGMDIGAASIGRDPGYQVQLRSQITLPRGFTMDAGLRAVGALENPHVDGYAEADARLGYQFQNGVEIFAVGDNLLHASHLESNDVQRTQRIERSFSVGARLRF